jgi:hypothetical protein
MIKCYDITVKTGERSNVKYFNIQVPPVIMISHYNNILLDDILAHVKFLHIFIKKISGYFKANYILIFY